MSDPATTPVAAPADPAASRVAGPAVAAESGAPLVSVRGLGYRYGDRAALDGLSLDVDRGSLFALLGPNGSGKTTFFRILATALRPHAGSVSIDGHDLVGAPDAVRRRLGVVFQSPSLDPKLSVAENLRFHGLLFGLRGRALRERSAVMLEQFGIAERRGERVETLSGGLKRRVELAKALLPGPPLLLLDEPSSGLDPAARLEFWSVLERLRAEEGLTVVVATHLMDEAERCDRVALLDRGRLVVLDDPETLRRQVGGDVLTIESADVPALAAELREKLGLEAAQTDGRLRVEAEDGLATAAKLLEACPEHIRSLTLGRPTLEDVFLVRTGHRLSQEEGAK